MTRPRAVLYGPGDGEEDRWLRTGTDWYAAMGYDLVTLVCDPDGSRWPAVFGLLVAGHVDVVDDARHRYGPTPAVPAQRQKQRPRFLRG